jgi:hypothetical protein
MIHKSLTLAQANELRAAMSKVAPTPEKGAHVGGGRHVKMPETWDGNGKVPPGWAGLDGVFEEEELNETVGPQGEKIITVRKLGTYAVGIMPVEEKDLGKFSAGELLKINAALDAVAAEAAAKVAEDEQ